MPNNFENHMNLSEKEIESALRRAPQPKPPADLKQELVAQVKLPATSSALAPTVMKHTSGGWLRRWWPALAPATVSIACAVVFAAQQIEISDLRASIRALSEGTAPAEAVPVVATSPARNDKTEIDPSTLEQQEIARLKQLANQLATEVRQLEQIQQENQSLRTQLATPPGLTAEELDALTKAREKAMSIQCINNLKQFGLAVRVWALDNGDVNPPDIICMSNELNTPKILVCPAETNRPVAASFTAFTSANCSYEYLAPSGSDKEPTRVLSRCPIHGHIGLCDGSVQGQVAKNHPEWLLERDGKLYYEHDAQPRTRPAPLNRWDLRPEPIPNR
jgi:hypothetical protein